MKTLIIDNYDSFTYNLYQLIAKACGIAPIVVKNDELSFDALMALEFDNVVISPGPGTPAKSHDFGICARVIQEVNKPILGVCLGHQGMAHLFGGHVTHAKSPMHGRVSKVKHNHHDLFQGVASPFDVIRYHSLIVDDAKKPKGFDIIATSADGCIMAMAHQTKPLYGLQFHPESIGSEYGDVIIANFNQLTERFYRERNLLTMPESFFLHVQKKPLNIASEALFRALYSKSEHRVWLDSSEAGFSYMGDDGGPYSHVVSYQESNRQLCVRSRLGVVEKTGSIFYYLKRQLALHQVEPCDLPFAFRGGFVGFLGYELKAELLDLSQSKKTDCDAAFVFLDRFIAIDAKQKYIYCVCLDQELLSEENALWFESIDSLQEKPYAPSFSKQAHQVISELVKHPEAFLLRDQKAYEGDISECQRLIRDGESYEICLTNKLKAHIPNFNLYDFYCELRQCSPTSYSAFLQFADLDVASASMERFLKIDANGCVETKPIKGTMPRSNDPCEDQRFADALKNDEKFFSENMMIVDLLRNDLGRVCEIGSVHVPKLMQVESYAKVHQLVSTVRGQLLAECDAIDCLKALFPGGSITGAPKRRTLEIIDQIEQEARGVYTGSLGYLSLDGAADFNIVIRTVVKKGDDVSIGIGGAIIALSDPELEFQEILLKAKAILQSFENVTRQAEPALLQAAD